MSDSRQPHIHKSQLESKIATAKQRQDTVLVDMLEQQLAELEDQPPVENLHVSRLS